MVEISRGVKLYFILATFALATAIYYEYKKQMDFYNMTMALQTKPLNVLILCNFILVLTDILCLLFIRIFFGELRSVEVSYLYDQFIKKFISIIIIFYFLSIDVTDKRCMAQIIYPTILFLLHKLTHKRMEFMTTKEDRNPWNYLRMGLLYIVLMSIDIVSVSMLFDPKLVEQDNIDLNVLQMLNVFTLLEILKMIMHL